MKLLVFIISIYIYYHHIIVDNLHYKIYFVEIVKVLFLDRILYIYIDYQLELYIQYGRIFVKSSLEIVRARKTRFEFETMFNKVVKPLFIYRCCTMCCTKKIGYTSYHIEPGRKYSRIQVKYISYERFFFVFSQDIFVTINVSAARVRACGGRCVGRGGCDIGIMSRVSRKAVDRFQCTWVAMIGEMHGLIAKYLGNRFR